MRLIELEDVTRSYESTGGAIHALDHVDFTVNDNEFVVILGPSGSGKTTLLNIIGGLDRPTSGRVTIAGRNITTASRGELFAVRRETVSFIFQSFNLFPGLTAKENVQFGADIAGRRNGKTAEDVLRQVGLEERTSQFPSQLSGGEQQRVAVARAVATGNPILLADEPTGELDYHTGVRIIQLLQEQIGEGRCVLLVTHNREIARTADRVLELSGGRIVSDGPPPGGKVDARKLFW
jgi:putative ABC transport system ATP-binding protein